PFASIGDCRRPSHPGIAAGDERLPAGEAAGTLVAALAVIGLGIHFAGKPGPGLRLRLKGRLGVFAAWILHRRLTVAVGGARRRAILGERGRRGGKRHPDADAADDLTTRHRTAIVSAHNLLLWATDRGTVARN